VKVELGGKLAVLTGASGALGKAIADALSANGATIASVDARDGPLSEAALDGAVERSCEPFLLVNLSRGAEGLPDGDQPAEVGAELRDFILTTRHFAARVTRVVNVVSAAGLVPLRGAAVFSAEQAGLVALTRTLAMELGPRVMVNAVAVGSFAAAEGEPRAARLLSHTALKRPARPGEIVAAVLFLADPANTYMTGHTLNVDGGWAAGYARDF
jgi:NAD(P)-dependent dehydrogenase (short-subunit alcohol dehydrogenase family)